VTTHLPPPINQSINHILFVTVQKETKYNKAKIISKRAAREAKQLIKLVAPI